MDLEDPLCFSKPDATNIVAAPFHWPIHTAFIEVRSKSTVLDSLVRWLPYIIERLPQSGCLILCNRCDSGNVI